MTYNTELGLFMLVSIIPSYTVYFCWILASDNVTNKMKSHDILLTPVATRTQEGLQQEWQNDELRIMWYKKLYYTKIC